MYSGSLLPGASVHSRFPHEQRTVPEYRAFCAHISYIHDVARHVRALVEYAPPSNQQEQHSVCHCTGAVVTRHCNPGKRFTSFHRRTADHMYIPC